MACDLEEVFPLLVVRLDQSHCQALAVCLRILQVLIPCKQHIPQDSALATSDSCRLALNLMRPQPVVLMPRSVACSTDGKPLA